MASDSPTDLMPGDCLLYRPPSFKPGLRGLTSWLIGRAIAIKTWNNISHVEVYAGEGWNVASRDGVGVNKYPLRTAGLAKVLRPVSPIFMADAMAWFENKACGQKYDWLGLMCFTLAVKQGAKDRMFCSEFATRFYREGHLQVFGQYDADKIAPAQFLMCDDFISSWNDGNR